MHVGELIKMHRERQKLSMNELAKRSGVSQSGISDMESCGSRQPTFDWLEKVVAGLGLTWTEFFNESMPEVPAHARDYIKYSKNLSPEQIEAINHLMKTMNKSSATNDIHWIAPVAAEPNRQYEAQSKVDKIAQMPYSHQRLRALREDKGLTQEELCELIGDGLPLKLLQDFEGGVEPINEYNQIKLAVFFKVSRSFLMGVANKRNAGNHSVNFEAAGKESPADIPLTDKERKAINEAKRSEGFYVEDES